MDKSNTIVWDKDYLQYYTGLLQIGNDKFRKRIMRSPLRVLRVLIYRTKNLMRIIWLAMKIWNELFGYIKLANNIVFIDIKSEASHSVTISFLCGNVKNAIIFLEGTVTEDNTWIV